MYCVKKMTEDLYWVGASERRLNLFENAYPLTNGVSYNSYLLLDEKTVLIDTVDKSVSGLFFENVDHVLAGRKLDYLIVQHMEPDHAATIGELVLRHPEVTIVCNAKTRTMMQNFFTFDLDSRVQLVKEMDTLTTGRHTFAFVMAPMVHWPEVMVSYDTATKTLYSADAFGTFGALNGNLYADEVNFRTEWLADARRYYTNIVGKYGTQVQALLKKAAGLEIEMICPLHGPVWRKDIAWFLDKYIHWATYTRRTTRSSSPTPPSTAARKTRRMCWPRSCPTSACAMCRCTTCPSRIQAISSPNASGPAIWSLSPRRTTRGCS